MKLTYDPQVDAASVLVQGPIQPGDIDDTERLDQDRIVDYDADDRVIAYEFLNVKRYGVRLDDLEHRDELARLFREAGFKERDWGAPLSALRVVKRRAVS
jgi:uncharacterized protein YuzE